MSNQIWNDQRFQIHWNKLKWVNPRSRIEVKNNFFYSNKLCLKDNNKTSHWVFQYKLKPLNKYLFQEKI